MNEDLANLARIFQSNVLPGFSGVDRLPHAVALRNVAPNASLSGSDIDNARIRNRHRDTADRGRSVLVKDRRPGVGAVGGLPNAAPGCSEVVGGGIARDARSRERTASAERTNRTIFHSLEEGVAFVLVLFGILDRGCGRGSFLRGRLAGALSLLGKHQGDRKQNEQRSRRCPHQVSCGHGVRCLRGRIVPRAMVMPRPR